MNVHSRLSSVMLVCKNAIITFWNALWSKNNKQINFITVLFFHTAPLHFMENKAHIIPLIRPRKVQYILLKALPRVCMENTARGGVSRDKYSTRRSRVLYLSRDTSPSAVFFVQTSKGSALGGILYFE